MGFVPELDCASAGRSGSAAVLATAPATATPLRMTSRRLSPWVISAFLVLGVGSEQGSTEGDCFPALRAHSVRESIRAPPAAYQEERPPRRNLASKPRSQSSAATLQPT